MKKLLIMLCLLALSVVARSQNEIESFVRQKTVPISSIDPDSLNFDDLEQIGNAIGDARIVMMGEQDHGDAPAFAAKTRLINYLHNKKGFNVVAFESDFFSATYGFENISKTTSAFLKYYKGNIIPFWTLCDACNSFFTKLVPESFATANPYIIAGFDNQQYLNLSGSTLSKIIDSMVRSNKLDILKDETVYNEIIAAIGTLSNRFICTTQKKDFYKKSVDDLLLLKTQLDATFKVDNIWSLLTDNLICFARQLILKDGNFTAFANTRDLQMAKNLAWLCSVKYPTEKIIVWAANFHVGKYSGHFSKGNMNKDISMATTFVQNEQLNKQTYVLGFSSYDGDAGRIGTKTFAVDKPDKNGFETWINDSINYAFINFKDFNQSNPAYNKEFEMKSSVTDQGVHKSHAAQWNKMFDGVFFIRHMYPCKVKN
jgi:erythromycin esterase-like protein